MTDYIFNVDFQAGAKSIGGGLACTGLAGAGAGIGTVLALFYNLLLEILI